MPAIGRVAAVNQPTRYAGNTALAAIFKSQKHDWSPENGYSNHFEAERDVMDFIVHYNHRRCHSASNNLPPATFEKLAA